MYYFLSFAAGVALTLICQHISRRIEDLENQPYRDYDYD